MLHADEQQNDGDVNKRLTIERVTKQPTREVFAMQGTAFKSEKAWPTQARNS